MLASLIKGWYNFRGKPYFRTVYKNNPDGVGVHITSDFNQFFIHELDKIYQASNARTYKPTAPDNDKVALYLYDVTSGIAEDLLEEDLPLGLEFEEDIPVMDLKGTGMTPQVIELGEGKKKVDFEAG